MGAYQLKITIKGSKPPVWRRMVVPDKIRFCDLHRSIQHGFCRDSDRMYEFHLPAVGAHVAGGDGHGSGMDQPIDGLISVGDKFTYINGFGDWCEHVIQVEKVLEDYPNRYPQVVKYKAGWDEKAGSISSYDLEKVNLQMKEALVFPETKARKGKKKRKGEEGSQERSIGELMDVFLEYLNEGQDPGQYHLTTILESSDKKDLVRLAKLHGLAHYSNKRKGDLIPYIAQSILQEEVLRSYFLYAYDYEIQAFEQVCQGVDPMDIEGLTGMDYFHEGGYCGMTNFFSYHVPGEVVAAYGKVNTPEFQKKRSRNSLLATCLAGASLLYGVTPFTQVLDMVNQYQEAAFSEAELLEAYGELAAHRQTVAFHDGYFMSRELADQDHYQELLKKQGDLPYYIPPRWEMEELAEYGGVIFTDQLLSLNAFLAGQKLLDEDQALMACATAYTRIRMGGGMREIADDMEALGLSFRGEKQSKRFFELLTALWNNCRIVSNRGYTPLEMAQINGAKQSRKVKIYPNQLCPCGSGKKYKYCCGRR